MKKIFSLFLIVTMILGLCACGDKKSKNENEELIPMRVGSKWGYINLDGHMIINPQFDDAKPFSEDLAAVKIDGKYGYINKGGDIVIDAQYEETQDPSFKTGYAIVKLNKKYGIIDKNGKYIAEAKYDTIGSFFDGLARVSRQGGYGYIDETGSEVISTQFSSAQDFSNGYALVAQNLGEGNKWGLIDTSGNIIQKPIYTNLKKESNGLFSASYTLYGETIDILLSNDGKEIIGDYDVIQCDEKYTMIEKDFRYGIVDELGRVIAEPQYNYIGSFNEGLCYVKKDGKCGYIDENGTLVIDMQYDDTQSFSEGLAAVEINGKYGYINKNNVMVIPPQFDGGTTFTNGYAWVSIFENGTYYHYCIDKTGNRIGENVYGNTIYNIYDSDGFAWLLNDTSQLSNGYLWQLVDKTGEVLVEQHRGYVYSVFDRAGYVEIEAGTYGSCKTGIVDTKQGKMIINPRYEEINILPNDLFSVCFNGKYGVVDKDNNIIFEAEYDKIYVLEDKYIIAKKADEMDIWVGDNKVYHSLDY